MGDVNKKSNGKFKAISGGKKEEYKYHLIVGDFEDFDFNQLLEEDEGQDYEGIIWNNGTTKRDLKVKKGDIVYIYYINLPDRINRILVRCSVLDALNDTKEIRLKFENALCVESDKERFSQDVLLNEYGINSFQGKQHLKEDLLQENLENGEQDYYQKKLIEDLENICNYKKYKNYSLAKLTEKMNEISRCSLEGCTGLKDANHKTFEKENGMNYYEAHHLIEQCNGRKNEKFPQKIIDNPKNIINLCSNCHNRIHHGKKDDRRMMVTYLYKKHESDFNELLAEIKEVKEGKTPLQWLLHQYNIDD